MTAQLAQGLFYATAPVANQPYTLRVDAAGALVVTAVSSGSSVVIGNQTTNASHATVSDALDTRAHLYAISATDATQWVAPQVQAGVSAEQSFTGMQSLRTASLTYGFMEQSPALRGAIRAGAVNVNHGQPNVGLDVRSNLYGFGAYVDFVGPIGLDTQYALTAPADPTLWAVSGQADIPRALLTASIVQGIDQSGAFDPAFLTVTPWCVQTAGSLGALYPETGGQTVAWSGESVMVAATGSDLRRCAMDADSNALFTTPWLDDPNGDPVRGRGDLYGAQLTQAALPKPDDTTLFPSTSSPPPTVNVEVSAVPTVLVSLFVSTPSASTYEGDDLYVQLHDSAEAPEEGANAVFSWPIAVTDGRLQLGRNDFGDVGIGLALGCFVVASSTPTTLTSAASAPILVNAVFQL